MKTNELPADFADRSRAVNGRIEAGEPMTLGYIAEQLGLPFETFAAALAVYVATEFRIPVLIDTSETPKPN